MEACYGGTDVMERPCAVARGEDINISLSVFSGPWPRAVFSPGSLLQLGCFRYSLQAQLTLMTYMSY
jgi:hypothetical protein